MCFGEVLLKYKEGFIYAIVEVDNKYYLGKFDNTLKTYGEIKKKEFLKILLFSIYKNKIYINRWDMKIIVLKKENLSLAGEVEKK